LELFLLDLHQLDLMRHPHLFHTLTPRSRLEKMRDDLRGSSSTTDLLFGQIVSNCCQLIFTSFGSSSEGTAMTVLRSGSGHRSLSFLFIFLLAHHSLSDCSTTRMLHSANNDQSDRIVALDRMHTAQEYDEPDDESCHAES